ncbi:phosphate butyryltransferase [Vallitalea guaymasensis]|uniref:Phosphate butyryltransferase n=1 Tax=Vallitalea guaymasensis TaxID=1185412 RepID=A0A8J8SEC5_9FIRM|nr:phosphate butyryltransferase [Vallitalea guaymasensis]QUH31793.1 phosphate butyryltransferase [Vallitalea guaymasensis]
MVCKFEDIMKLAKTKEPKVLSVAVAQDIDVLISVKMAIEEGIIKAILVGDKEEILKIAKQIDFNVEDVEIIDEKDKVEACNIAVKKVTDKEADMVMKGIIDTAVILKAVLNKEANLRTGRVLSHVGVMDIPGYERVLLISDAAMNIEPDLMTKKQIIDNSVIVARSIGINEPKVAMLCAKEKVNEKMQATVDAKELEEMNKRGEIHNCIVGGPLALDNAVSVEAANHKKIDNPVAGKADILIVPSIEAGNVLYKSLVFLANAKAAGVIVGAKVPIVVTSRADTEISKINSIALAMLMTSE